MPNLYRRRGAYLVAGLVLTALVHATPGKAVLPTNVAAAVEQAEDAVPAPVSMEADEQAMHVADGVASYYGNELAGNRTASGERFNPEGLTAAHRTLPLGSKLRVTNKSNGRSVVVRVNDRGPHAKGRILDMSLAAARKIAMVGAGTATVRIHLLS